MINVRKYGLLRPPVFDQSMKTCLWLQTKFWNRLVEIDRDNREKYQARISASPQVADQEALEAFLKAQNEEAFEERALARKKAGSKKFEGYELYDQRITAIKRDLAILYPILDKLRKLEQKNPENKPFFDALNEEHKLVVKTARQESNLYWATYNNILERYKTARTRAMKEGQSLQFHTHDETGTFAVQLQKPLTVDQLFDHKSNAIKLTRLNQTEFRKLLGLNGEAKAKQNEGSRASKRTYAKLEIIYANPILESGRTSKTVVFPLILHRPIPSDAQIKRITVSRRRVGYTYKWTVSFMSKVEDIEAIVPKAVCGINFGWRKVKEGLRVATIFSKKGTEFVILPSKLLERFDQIRESKSELDLLLNEAVRWIKQEPIGTFPEEVHPQITKVKRARLKNDVYKVSPYKLHKLLTWWTNDLGALPEPLSLWLQSETKLRTESAKLEQQSRGWREDIYKNVGKHIAESYGLINIEDFDLRSIVKQKKQLTEDEGVEEVRRLRQIASISELRLWISNQIAKTGSLIEKHKKRTTQHCANCNTDNDLTDEIRASGIMVKCAHCKASMDQDQNAARVLYETEYSNAA